MNTYLIIIGKSSVAVMFFFLFYRFVLSNDKLFVRNRFFLLSSCLLSLILPWVKIPIIQVFSSPKTFTYTYIDGGNSLTGVAAQSGASFSWVYVIAIFYFLGTLFFLVKTFMGYFQVLQIIRRALCLPFGKMKMVVTSKKVSPFSFLHWFVISEDTQQHPSFEKMVQHEMVHSRQYHSVDLLIGEVLIFFQWFNPFAWLIRKSIIENLEFIVDHEMLAKGVDVKEYQYSLLSFSMAGLKPAVANNFNTNLLKKRITMMNLVKYQKRDRLHNCLIPVCLVIALLITVSFKKEARAESYYFKEKLRVVQPVTAQESSSKQMKEIIPITDPSENKVASPSGEEYFLGYIMKNVVYPQEARESNISGTVKIRITFKSKGVEISSNDASGSIREFKEVFVVGYAPTGIKIIEGKHSTSNNLGILTSEVERVANSFHEIPIELVGKTYTLPVTFLIKSAPISNESQPTVILNDGKETVSGQAGYIIVEEDAMKADLSQEPIYILNDEKIISKEEAQNIDPDKIASINIRKKGKYVSEKLGEMSGSFVLITLR